jgi:hypothetical protein
LFLVLGWEPTAALVPGYLKRFTIAYYLQALVAHEPPNDAPMGVLLARFVSDVPTLWASLAALTFVIAGGIWLAGRAVERREYVLEQ